MQYCMYYDLQEELSDMYFFVLIFSSTFEKIPKLFVKYVVQIDLGLFQYVCQFLYMSENLARHI